MLEPTIYLVEDDDAVRESLVWMLIQAGYRVEAHADPSDLLDAYDASRPGCLVFDLKLPGMSGLELREKLVASGSSHPFLIMTGHGEVPDATRAMRMGAVDFIEKPLDRTLLLERIHEAIAEDCEQRKYSSGAKHSTHAWSR
ncbi:MAG: response regulator [Planctomycetaceae bacterium]|nr:response regulator [Planctomycetaceae bacterium]